MKPLPWFRTSWFRTSWLRLRTRPLWSLGIVAALCTTFAVACLSTRTPPPREGYSIVVCGQRFDIGTPVVLWSDPGGYDAYSEVPRFEEPKEATAEFDPRGKRYGERRNLPPGIAQRVAEHGFALDDLRQVVDQFVVHFDVCGNSRQCFKILQDKRKLSVHFMLDVDGTIYQTLDLKERAWHATIANDRAIGIEIAHIGAYSAPGHPVMRSWYGTDEKGVFVKFPAWMTETGVRTPGFVARPQRPELISGSINGNTVWMHDYTPQQHAALAKLVAGLSRVFPKIALDVPRGADGRPLDRVLDEGEFAAFHGVLGHYHVQKNKDDPGPALDWERLLRDARGVTR
ncbi:MAG: N-acetylmuramoyl-L-alanine amidase [Planctomycetota bacterium]